MIPININSISSFDTIYIHEDHRPWFMKYFETKDVYDGVFRPLGYTNGFDIRFVGNIPKWRQRWKFPDTPFVEYSREDEVWARPIGFGYLVDTDEPAIFAINTSKYLYYIFKPTHILSDL